MSTILGPPPPSLAVRGEMVKRARIGRDGVGLSLRYVAERLGFSEQEFSDIEAGNIAADHENIIVAMRALST